MTMDFAEHMTVEGLVCSTHTFAVEPYRKSLPSPPRFNLWPSCSHGYRPTWEIRECGHEHTLLMIGFHSEADLPLLFPHATLPLAATWFSGIIRGVRGERRRAGYPPRDIYPDEIYVEITAGRVVREWMLDLRAVPDQTEEEWRQSVPFFLWKYYPRPAPG